MIQTTRPTDKKYPTGISLLELLLALSLTSLLAGLSIPFFERIQANQLMRNSVNSVTASIKRMKSYSILHHQEVVLCGTSNSQDCQKNWTQGFMSFADLNRNRKRDPDEAIIEYHRPFKPGQKGKLYSCSRRYFRTRNNGPLASMPGSIVYTPSTKHADLARRIYIARLGRTKVRPTTLEKPCSSS